MRNSSSRKFIALQLALAVALTVLPVRYAHAVADPAGSNVSSGGTVYFISAAGQKQAYTSAGAFLSYRFNSWANVTPATPDDLNLPSGSFVPPMDGSLINDHGTVYIITSGARAAFTSAQVFLGLGYSFGNAILGDTSFLPTLPPISSTAQAHVPGTIVLDHITTPPTAYLITALGKEGIPSPAVFSSWGYSWAGAVESNSFDWALPQASSPMPLRVAGYLSPLSQPSSASSPAAVPSASVPATQISGVAAASITSTSATINWVTANPATSSVSYGTTTAHTLTAPTASSTSAALVVTHSVALTGLAPSTLYHYQVSSQTANGAAATSADAIFTTTTAQVLVTTTPSSLGFSSVEVGTASAPETVTITNTGSLPANIVSAASSSYQFVVSGLNSSGLTPMAPGQSVTLSVVFNPVGLDTVNASILITFDVAPAQIVALTGSAYPVPQD